MILYFLSTHIFERLRKMAAFAHKKDDRASMRAAVSLYFVMKFVLLRLQSVDDVLREIHTSVID